MAAVVGCSTTAKLGDGETLYVGVKKFTIDADSGVVLSPDVNDAVFKAINVKPNNCLVSPYYRHPFAIGLWVYNHWSDSSKGLKKWLYNKLVAKPVLIEDDVNPTLRLEMMNAKLRNSGYFGSWSSYELLPQKNPKKAKISYTVRVHKPYTISKIYYFEEKTPLARSIDSLVRKNPYLTVGNRYSVDSLSDVRTSIANTLRNRGFYYFRPEYIEYLADSLMTPGEIAIKLRLSKSMPHEAAQQYYVRSITTTVMKNSSTNASAQRRSRWHFDTIPSGKKGNIILQRKMRLKPQYVAQCILMSEGRRLTVRSMDNTQAALANTGIFNSIGIDVTDIDSLKPGCDSVDVRVSCVLDQTMEAKFEVQATSKSNSYIGPGLSAGVTHKNIFGGGEQFNAEVGAAYEWQTGGKGGADGQNRPSFNSYLFRLSTGLAFPRLLAPRFLNPSRRYTTWTRIDLSGDILNRPRYFKMVHASLFFGWEWNANRYSRHNLNPFKLTYSKVLSSTEEFEEAMKQHRAVAESFRDQFVPQLSWSYTYNRDINPDNNISFSSTLTEAGNAFAGIWALCGVKGEKTLFKTPFSQFVKGTAQVVWKRRLMGSSFFVTRAFIGAAHAYGNSTQVPYSEQFYIGGANSVRAFAVRSIGPGRYHPAVTDANGYYDETGTLKLELNAEYRFPIWGYLKGALFVDAGNVWLMQEDEARPGGVINARDFLKDLALGTGLGIRFDMGMLVVRGDLGIGIHAPYDTGRSGYYNMHSFKNSLTFHLALGYPF